MKKNPGRKERRLLAISNRRAEGRQRAIANERAQKRPQKESPPQAD